MDGSCFKRHPIVRIVKVAEGRDVAAHWNTVPTLDKVVVQAVTYACRVQMQVLPDMCIGQARTHQQSGRVNRASRDHYSTRLDRQFRSLTVMRCGFYRDAYRLTIVDQHTLG